MLNKRVLVLNKSWIPVNITTVKRAICLLYSGLARVVHPKTYETYDFEQWQKQKTKCYLRGVTSDIPVSEIIVLRRYNELRTRHRVPFSRVNLLKRDGHTCQYCGQKDKGSQLTIDHIVPRSRGGTTSWQNCVTACSPCNRRKGDRLLHELGYKLRKQPTMPVWAFEVDPAENEAWEAFTNGKKTK